MYTIGINNNKKILVKIKLNKNSKKVRIKFPYSRDISHSKSLKYTTIIVCQLLEKLHAGHETMQDNTFKMKQILIIDKQ